jgi:hypothetical protein
MFTVILDPKNSESLLSKNRWTKENLKGAKKIF